MTQISEIQAEFAKALGHINSTNKAGISAIEEARSEERASAKDSLKGDISTATDNAQADLEAFEAVKNAKDRAALILYMNENSDNPLPTQ